MENKYIEVNDRKIGDGHPAYVIAELSANHNQDIEVAIDIIHASHEAGADAIKLQTYTADTMTIDSDLPPFVVPDSTAWGGQTLFQLYEKAYTPWEWQPKLKEVADDLGIEFLSTPFDASAVDFLDEMRVNVFKVASFEITDIPLLRKIASKGKPMIISTGMASVAEIDEAIKTVRGEGNNEFMLLRCASAYPSPPEALDLWTIPHMKDTWGVPVGFSDHSIGPGAAIAAVALGACAVEKHVTMSSAEEGPDNFFSIEPDGLKVMIDGIRVAEKAAGEVRYGPSEHEHDNLAFRRGIWIVKDMKAGDVFDDDNVRVIRPSHGLSPKYFEVVLGRQVAEDTPRGTPLNWSLIAD
jgi:pseudaminic acid synthase